MGNQVNAQSRRAGGVIRPARWLGVALALLGLSLLGGEPALATGPGGNTPAVTISAPNPPSGPAGTNVVLSGLHWTPGTTLTFALSDPAGACAADSPPLPGVNVLVNAGGTFQVNFTWPTTVAAGTYFVCANGPGAPRFGQRSDNSFTDLSQSPPNLTLPASAAAGAVVSFTGAGWLPAGTVVGIWLEQSGGTGCASNLGTATAQADGTIAGTFIAPATPGVVTIIALSPPNACTGTATLRATATLTIVGTATPTPGAGTPGPGTPGAGTPGPGTPGAGTPGPGTPGAGTPGAGTPGPGTPGAGTPGPGTPGAGTPGPGTPGAGTPTVTPTPHTPGGIGALPYGPVCLTLLALFVLFLLLFLLLLRRRNQEIVVSEEDITDQIDPHSVAPLGAMRFVRAVRVTTQVVDRRTGTVRRSRTREYDEFADSGGATRRRPRR